MTECPVIVCVRGCGVSCTERCVKMMMSELCTSVIVCVRGCGVSCTERCVKMMMSELCTSVEMMMSELCTSANEGGEHSNRRTSWLAGTYGEPSGPKRSPEYMTWSTPRETNSPSSFLLAPFGCVVVSRRVVLVPVALLVGCCEESHHTPSLSFVSFTGLATTTAGDATAKATAATAMNASPTRPMSPFSRANTPLTTVTKTRKLRKLESELRVRQSENRSGRSVCSFTTTTRWVGAALPRLPAPHTRCQPLCVCLAAV
jgi:hypothetical protein